MSSLSIKWPQASALLFKQSLCGVRLSSSDLLAHYSAFSGENSQSKSSLLKVQFTGFYFLRRTAVLILRPAIACCPAGEAWKDLVDPILNTGGCAKLNPPPGAPDWLAGGAGEAADPAPKVNTPEELFVAPNAPAPPNWKPPPDAEFVDAPNTGVEFACCPKTGVELGLAPKAGVCDCVAGKGDPKVEPNEGVWLAPNAAEGAGLNTNGVGAVDGAEEESAGGAAAPKPKEGAAAAAAAGAAVAGAPKMKG